MTLLLDRILRRPVADRQDTPTPDASTPIAATRADDVLLRFLTQGGATVVVTGSGAYHAEDNRWECLGCEDGTDPYSSGRFLSTARESANGHATKCRALPKPTA